jgi:hypothetical protein
VGPDDPLQQGEPVHPVGRRPPAGSRPVRRRRVRRAQVAQRAAGAGVLARELDRLADEDDAPGPGAGPEERAVGLVVPPLGAGVVRVGRAHRAEVGVEVDVQPEAGGAVDQIVDVEVAPAEGLRVVEGELVRGAVDAADEDQHGVHPGVGDGVEVGVREVVEGPAGVGHPRAEARRADRVLQRQEGRPAQIHQVLEEDAALEGAAGVGAADHHPRRGAAQAVAAGPGEGRAGAGRLVLRGEHDQPLAVAGGRRRVGHPAQPDGEAHAGEEVLLEVPGRGQHGRGAGLAGDDAPVRIERHLVRPRRLGVVPALPDVHLGQAPPERVGALDGQRRDGRGRGEREVDHARSVASGRVRDRPGTGCAARRAGPAWSPGGGTVPPLTIAVKARRPGPAVRPPLTGRAGRGRAQAGGAQGTGAPQRLR